MYAFQMCYKFFKLLCSKSRRGRLHKVESLENRLSISAFCAQTNVIWFISECLLLNYFHFFHRLHTFSFSFQFCLCFSTIFDIFLWIASALVFMVFEYFDAMNVISFVILILFLLFNSLTCFFSLKLKVGEIKEKPNRMIWKMISSSESNLIEN